MPYLPQRAFDNILSYCDNRIEQNQKIELAKCLAVLKHLRLLADCNYLDTKKLDLEDGFLGGDDNDVIHDLDFSEWKDSGKYHLGDVFDKTSRMFLKSNAYNCDGYFLNWVDEKTYNN